MRLKPTKMAWAGLFLSAVSIAGCQNTPPNLPANAPPPLAGQGWPRGGFSQGAMVNPTAGTTAPNLAATGGVPTNATLAGNMTTGAGWTNNANANGGWNNGVPMRPMNGTPIGNTGMAQQAAGYSPNMQNNNVQQASWNQDAQPAQGSAPAPVWPVTNAGDNGLSRMTNGPANTYQPNMPPPGNPGDNQGNMAQPTSSNYSTTYPQMQYNRGQ